MQNQLNCFKAYDIRGSITNGLDDKLAFALGQAIGEVLMARVAVVGRDPRLSGKSLIDALTAGLASTDVEVSDIGICGTEEIYYAAAQQDYDVGIMITGSHNPSNENGFKLVRKGAIPISGDNDLPKLRARVAELLAAQHNCIAYHISSSVSYRSDYVQWLLSYSGFNERKQVRQIKIVADAGNGCAGLVLKELAKQLPIDLVIVHGEPDGNFPNGVPNPLLPENRSHTINAVQSSNCDFGIAFDGDFDRCFFYDGDGNFIEGYYCVGLLAAELLQMHPNEKIVHDPRCYWNTREIVLKAGGIPVMCKTGHAFIKERMRHEDALYGGEMSAHHYFRDFAYCDSGMLPWLLVASMINRTGRTLSECVEERMNTFPCSGEINRKIKNPSELLREIEQLYAKNAVIIDHIDGLSMEYQNWRFNLRMSNTEPLVRLNVETRGDKSLLHDMTSQLLEHIDNISA